MSDVFSIIGLALNLMGVIVLFRYGMPTGCERKAIQAVRRFSMWNTITLVCLASEPS